MREYVARAVKYCVISTRQNSCGGPKPRIANTDVGSGLKTTMYAALALDEECKSTCTPSPPDPWQVGGSFVTTPFHG